MANPFVKGWRYLMALFGAKIDEYADPKVQIQQAIEDAQRQHQALVQQAAAVIGNQLVASEQSMEDLKTLHDQALSAAGQARKAVENNSHILQQKSAERTKLLSQLEQAKMQETVARSLESMSSLAAPGNTPSLDEVREKIERRYATAMGRAELASNSVEGRMLEVQKSTLDMAGASRLDQIRASMSGEKLAAAPEKQAVEAAPEATPADTGRNAGVARLDDIRASMGKDKATGDTSAAG